MYIISVVNLKGGVGKSTVAVNLACALKVGSSEKVTIVDADPQGTATRYHAPGLLAVKLITAPLELSKDADRWARNILQSAVDLAVIDVPPALGAAAHAAVAISDLVLIPCTPSNADLAATKHAVQLVREIQRARPGNDGSPQFLLIPSRVDRRTLSGREIGAALLKVGEVGPTIHQRAAFVDALTGGMWVGDFSPGSPAHDDVIKLAEKVRKIRRAYGKDA